MANWYHNTLKIEQGETAEVFNFISSPLSHFDFNKVKPMPEELKVSENTVGAIGEAALYGRNIEEVLAWNRFKEEGIQTQEQLLEYLKSEKCPYSQEALHLGECYHSNREKFGFSTWYEWCYDNWGTKWNTREVIRKKEDGTGEEVIHFDTANGVPLPILKYVSKQFPGATISLFISSIDSMCEGFVKWKNGEVIEDEYRELTYDEIFGKHEN